MINNLIAIFTLVFGCHAFAKEKSIPCDGVRPRLVHVALGRVTVLNFPYRPRDVVPGSNAFDFKQIKDDLIIMAAKSGGRTNAIVYLEDRRCAFDLIAVKGRGDDVLIVKDPKDSEYEVKFNERKQ